MSSEYLVDFARRVAIHSHVLRLFLVDIEDGKVVHVCKATILISLFLIQENAKEKGNVRDNRKGKRALELHIASNIASKRCLFNVGLLVLSLRFRCTRLCKN